MKKKLVDTTAPTWRSEGAEDGEGRFPPEAGRLTAQQDAEVIDRDGG
jgi:hypothetical protein